MRQVGFGIKILSEIADFENASSKLITETLTIKVNQERQHGRYSRIKNINNKMTGERYNGGTWNILVSNQRFIAIYHHLSFYAVYP